MRDPFQKASRRIVRRLGKPVTMVTVNGVRLEMKGVFDHPEHEVITKGKRGGLTLKADVPTLTVLGSECPELNKELRIFVDEREYYPVPSKSFDDGAGCMVIVLADPVPDQNYEDEQTDGGKWR